jgi:hypothetical protein
MQHKDKQSLLKYLFRGYSFTGIDGLHLKSSAG